MQCFVYASLRKADSYVWLARRDDFEVVPEALRTLLGPLRFALEVDLHAQRRLPHEDPAHVLANLHEQGWHLQAPPPDSLTGASALEYGRAPRDGHAR